MKRLEHRVEIGRVRVAGRIGSGLMDRSLCGGVLLLVFAFRSGPLFVRVRSGLGRILSAGTVVIPVHFAAMHARLWRKLIRARFLSCLIDRILIGFGRCGLWVCLSRLLRLRLGPLVAFAVAVGRRDSLLLLFAAVTNDAHVFVRTIEVAGGRDDVRECRQQVLTVIGIEMLTKLMIAQAGDKAAAQETVAGALGQWLTKGFAE